jgi:hypothetical protein
MNTDYKVIETCYFGARLELREYESGWYSVVFDHVKMAETGNRSEAYKTYNRIAGNHGKEK